MRTTEFLETVRRRVEAEGFIWIDGPTDGMHKFLVGAKRRRFEATKVGMATSFFVFEQFDRLDLPGMRGFMDDAFAYADRSRGGFLPRGLFEAVYVFAVALANATEPDVVRWVQDETPPKKWAAFVIPVVVDMSTAELSYIQKTPTWGAAYWREFRDTAQRILSPS